jgi:multidrug transporter EmrE-like cation transporter
MNNLVLGVVYAMAAQLLTFLQLQGNIKYNWYQRYTIPMLLLSIPISWLFIKSVDHIVKAYDGEIYPSRLIGFGIGIIVFGFMSWLMFKEPITTKTIVCLILSVAILSIQVWWK